MRKRARMFLVVSLGVSVLGLTGCMNTWRGAWLDGKGAYRGIRATFDNTEVHQWTPDTGGSQGWDPNGGRYGPGPLDHPSYGRP